MTRLTALLSAAALLAGCERPTAVSRDGTTPGCLPGSVDCGGVCTRLDTDRQNCGACGVACGAGKVCSSGECTATCGSPLSTCGEGEAASCADLRNDPAHCGACATACAAGHVCVAGECSAACASPLVECGTGDASYCADLRGDPSNCGACGTVCPSDQLCSAGSCVPACGAPLTRCGDGAAAFCADLRADPVNCGACGSACAEGEACLAGACVTTCAGAGGTLCGAACVDLHGDDANCGACGNACAAGTACRDGACTPTCPPPQIPCGGTCLDPRADVANCGACGHACPAEALCREGACAAAACAGALGFPGGSVPSPSPVAGESFGSALADLDGDGKLELAFSRTAVAMPSAPRAIEVRRLLADGDVGPALVTTLEGGATRLAAGDVDGDGDVDLVALTPTLNAVAVLENGGDASFAVTSLPLGKYADVALGDLDGDGDLDLVLAGGGDPHVYVSLNPGDGRFPAPVAYDAGKPGPRRLALADLDGDGKLDVVVGNGTGTRVIGAPEIDNGSVSIFKGGGDGTLGAPATFAVGAGPEGLAVADLTGDGKLDVVVGAFGIDAIVVLPGDGAGGLLPGTATPVDRPIDVAVGDLDGDGLLDVVVNRYSEDVVVFRNAGLGVLGPAEPYLAGSPDLLHVADVTGDGAADVIVASGRPRVLVQHSGVLLSPSPLGDGNGADVLADFDGDGVLDRASRWAEQIAIARGKGDGTFEPRVLVPAPGGTSELAAGDLDGDGKAELVHAGSVAYVRRNLGGLTFGPEEPLATSWWGPNVAVLDVDGDGDRDVVLLFETELVPYQQPARSPVVLFLNDGAGHLGGPVVLASGYGPRRVAAGDLTGDGIPDLVVSQELHAQLSVFRGLGGGAFEAAFFLATGSYPSTPAILDVDGDGKKDLAIATWAPRSRVRVFAGGQRTLGAPQDFFPGTWARDLLVADVDSDGRDDLVVAGPDVAVWRAAAGGGLALAGIYEAGDPVHWLVGDVTGDLRPDVVVVGEGPGGVAVLRNRCLP